MQTSSGGDIVSIHQLEADVGAVSTTTNQASLEMKFLRLRDEWKTQRGHEPSTMKAVLLPAYQTIIGIGPAAIPFLLRELETNVDNWFWALMAITEEDPVKESIRGDGKAMAQAWLKWGKDHGYQW
jgi:hypothetical protein